MIARLRGTIASIEDGSLELATTSGVTYEVRVPGNLSVDLTSRTGEIELFTHQVVTDSAVALFGFSSAEDRGLFTLLLAAQGVGAKLALAMMSTLTAHRLVRALAEADLAVLTQVPGIGKRSAEKISVSLKERAKDLAKTLPTTGEEGTSGAEAQAVQALVGLGMNFQEAERRVRQVLRDAHTSAGDTREVAGDAPATGTPAAHTHASDGPASSDLPTEEIIRRALQTPAGA